MMHTSSREQAIKVSVIIPVWNGRQYLRDCLDAVLGQGYADLEIIAVDNTSTDGSGCFVSDSYPNVRLVRNTQNLGFAGGCNAGLRAAQGEFLVLLNQDTVVRPGWLGALVRGLQEPGVGIVGCKILYPDGGTIQHAGGWIEWPLGLAYHYGRGERDEGQWNTRRTVEYVTGAAMGFRHELVEKIGLLDEAFWPGYFEDTDFCFRAQEAGYQVLYVPDAVLVHQENTAIRDPRIAARACQRGRLRFVLKHLSPDRFLAEFLPAEGAGDLDGIWGQERAFAYLEATLVAARLLRERWQADNETIRRVLESLQRLFQSAWARQVSDIVEPSDAFVGSLPPLESRPIFPVLALSEYEFHSSVPVIGPLIVKVRSFWFDMAARWATRHLRMQQEAINRQQELHLYALEQRLAVLAGENECLAREVARLSQQLGFGEE